MLPNESELAEMERYFSSKELPTVFKTNKATTYNDLPKFIENAFITIRTREVLDLTKRVRWEDLCQIKNVLENGLPAETA